MPYAFNPFTGTFDKIVSTAKGDSAYSTLQSISGDLVYTGDLYNKFLPLSGGTITGNLSVAEGYIFGDGRNITNVNVDGGSY